MLPPVVAIIAFASELYTANLPWDVATCHNNNVCIQGSSPSYKNLLTILYTAAAPFKYRRMQTFCFQFA